MAMTCVDYVDEFYPFGIEPAWKAMIEEWCATGVPPWVVAVASLRMLLRTGPRASIAPTDDVRRRWEELVRALMRKNTANAEAHARSLCGGTSFNLDLWIALLELLKNLFPDYDEAFLAYLFDKCATLQITETKQLEGFVKVYKAEHPIRPLTP